MMKFAFFTPTLQIGGYERVVVTYANYIAEILKEDVFIICGDSNGDLKEQISSKIDIIDLQCRTKTLLLKLVDYFRRYSPDVFYSGFRIYNSLAILACKIAGNNSTKIYISQHGYEYQKGYIKFIHRIIQKNADGFIAVTDSLRDFEKKELNLKCPSCVVGNPVISSDRDILTIKDSWFDDGTPIICVCARLSADKNVTLAIQILQKLLERSYNIKMLILGDGPELSYLKMMSSKKHLQNYIRFQGFVKNPVDYMVKCSVYLHTCDKEGFGNTVVEALYAGLPVVTTDCGGPIDIIEKNKYGKNFGSGRSDYSPIYGADAIIEVLEKKWDTKSLKKKALSYSVENMVSKLMEFLIGTNYIKNK